MNTLKSSHQEKIPQTIGTLSSQEKSKVSLKTHEIIKRKVYKSSINTTHGNSYAISATLETAENGKPIINLSLKEIKVGKKDVTYKFKVGIEQGWKIVNRIYAGSGSDPIPVVEGLRIRYITKEDKNGGGPRFANRGGENIRTFDYFRRYLIEIEHDRIVNEIKRALLYISAS